MDKTSCPPSYTRYPTAGPRPAMQIAHSNAFDALPVPNNPEENKRFLLVTPRRLVFVSVWFVPQVAFLIFKIVQGSHNGSPFTGYNNGVEDLMMFNISSIFLFMAPTLIGLLRETALKRLFDFDKHIHAHKLASYTLVFLIINHVIAHYYKFHKLEQQTGGKMKMSNLLFNGTTGRIGHVMIFTVVLILVGAIPYMRRKHFEIFYLLHHLHYVVIVLIFFHTKDTRFHYFITAPLSVYLLDRLYRLYRGFANRPRILSVIRHPSGVIELRFEKRSIKPKAGQYIYLNVPSISWFEWHPFTLTSAPEEDELSVHIRINGDWTRRLVHVFRQHESTRPRRLEIAHQSISYPPSAKYSKLADDSEHQQHQREQYASSKSKSYLPSYYHPLDSTSHHRSSLHPSGMFNTNKILPPVPIHDINLPTVRVDGPYSAPTQHVFEFETAVLISGNIGVTPMSSVLKSLYYQLIMARKSSPRTTKKVYFIWLCRETQSLEWFKDLLAALDEENISEILEIRTYITGQLSVDQIRNIALSQDPDGPDAITGLYRSPTYYGRPNFDKIYEDIGMRNPGTNVGVFFCGSKHLARHLRRTNSRWNSELSHRGTKFVFHEEKNQS